MMYFRQQFKSNTRTCMLQAILRPQREQTKLFSLRMHITCQLCQAGHAVPVPLPPEKVNKLHHAMHWSSGAGKCITSRQSACNYSKRCTLSGLMHPNGGACVQSVASRTPIYTSHCLLGGRTGCTMRCFAAGGAGLLFKCGMCLYGDSWAPTEPVRACTHMLHGP